MLISWKKLWINLIQRWERTNMKDNDIEVWILHQSYMVLLFRKKQPWINISLTWCSTSSSGGEADRYCWSKKSGGVTTGYLWNPMEKWGYSPYQLVSRISSIVCRPWLVFQGGDFPYNGLQYIGIIPASSSTFQRYPAAKFGHFLGDPQWKSCHPTLMSCAKRPCPCFSRVSSLALASYPNAVRTWRYERLAPVVGCAKRKRKVRSGQTWAKGKHTGSRWRRREIEKDCIQRRTP